MSCLGSDRQQGHEHEQGHTKIPQIPAPHAPDLSPACQSQLHEWDLLDGRNTPDWESPKVCPSSRGWAGGCASSRDTCGLCSRGKASSSGCPSLQGPPACPFQVPFPSPGCVPAPGLCCLPAPRCSTLSWLGAATDRCHECHQSHPCHPRRVALCCPGLRGDAPGTGTLFWVCHLGYGQGCGHLSSLGLPVLGFPGKGVWREWKPREMQLERCWLRCFVMILKPLEAGALCVPLAPVWGALQWAPIPAQGVLPVKLVTLQPALCPQAWQPPPVSMQGTEPGHRALAVAVWAGPAGVAAPHTHGQTDRWTMPSDKLQPQKFPLCC